MKRISLVLAGVILAVAIAALSAGINAGETPTKIRIIYTNDLMGYIAPCG